MHRFSESAACHLSFEFEALDFLEERLLVARAWSSLTTNRKKKPLPRLQPPERFGMFAPAPLDSAAKLAEALSLADRLIARAAEEPAPTRDWVSTTLHDATMGNAGTRIRTPDALKAWCGVAVTLRDAPRWLVERIDPMRATREEKALWVGARHGEMRAGERKSKIGRSIVVRCRLLSPSSRDACKRAPAESWAGCVRLAAHLAAVHLGYAPVTAENETADWQALSGSKSRRS